MTVIAPATITALSTRPSCARIDRAFSRCRNHGKQRPEIYLWHTRHAHKRSALCKAIDALEGSAGTVCVPSGLAAITVPLLGFLSPGDHALLVDSIYYPTRHFANTILKTHGCGRRILRSEIGADIAKLMRPNTKVVFTESPASNTFEIQDIPAIAEAAHKGNAIVMMDNTWATPLYFGRSISAWTSAFTPQPNIPPAIPTFFSAPFRPMRNAGRNCWKHTARWAFVAGPDDTYQILRRLRTMGIRLEHHRKSALEIARWLENHPMVERVLHPALESHPGHEIWKRDFSGSSGIFSFVLAKGGHAQASAFLNALEMFRPRLFVGWLSKPCA